jgi:hypothetical protein
MDKQSEELLLELLDKLVNQAKSQEERCVQGRVGLDDDDNLIVEIHIDDHCIALQAEVLDDDTFSITFAGGYRNGERFELGDVFVLKDEVDALVQLPGAIITAIPELAGDREGIKEAIHDNWMEPEAARAKIDAMRLMSSLGEDYNG